VEFFEALIELCDKNIYLFSKSPEMAQFAENPLVIRFFEEHTEYFSLPLPPFGTWDYWHFFSDSGGVLPFSAAGLRRKVLDVYLRIPRKNQAGLLHSPIAHERSPKQNHPQQ
jgi:hypothetical protein